MKRKTIGYGAGSKNFDGFANVLKIVKGESVHQLLQDSVQILETNIDDVSGEVIGLVIDKLISNGAKDVTVSSAITKKGRPTNLVSVICDASAVNGLIDILVSETGTLGVRIRDSNRYIVPRILLSVPVVIHGKSFTVRCRIAKDNDVMKHFKLESEDVKLVSESLDIPFKDTVALISSEVKEKIHLK